MTLLVLELRVPEDADGHLMDALRHEWPAYMGYFISFTLIGIIWVNHHALFRDLSHIDRPLLFLNLLLLFCVVLIPFPTSLLARYIRSPESDNVAVAVYSGVMLSMAVSFTLLWWWCCWRNLYRVKLSPREYRVTLARALVGVSVYTLAIGLSFLDAMVTLGFHAAVALFYILDQCVNPGPESQRSHAAHETAESR
jgi:uncharacterized membrane protein